MRESSLMLSVLSGFFSPVLQCVPQSFVAQQREEEGLKGLQSLLQKSQEMLFLALGTAAIP